MKVRLTSDEAKILSEVAQKHKLENRLAFAEHSSCQVVTLNEDDADELRDFCSEYLLEVGFDEKYDPTSKGKLLESLVDKLFVDG